MADDTDDTDDTDDSGGDLLTQARHRLYGAAPEGFMSLRTELVRAAREAGAPAVAKQIANLRKPTLSASVVNRHVLRDGAVCTTLAELGDRLRTAQADLDAPAMRELTTERRTTVTAVTDAALAGADAADASSTVRDEVRATFDAAVADPDIAGRLGSLLRPESFSGFGTAVPSTPELTLVRGGGRRSGTHPDPRQPATRVPAATRRKLQRELDKARRTMTASEQELVDAEQAERHSAQQVAELAEALAELQHQLAAAKDAHQRDQHALSEARSARRRARSALDRAERDADS